MEKIDSKEVGLELGLRVFKFFLKTEYLHYGYFEKEMPIEIQSLALAQENYFQLLRTHIPDTVRTLLDVGCGSGKTAYKLMDEGFAVDVVSPGVFLTQYARDLMRGKGHIYASKFEEVQTSTRYDLVLFSESFQYIPLQESLRKAESLLNPGGFVMICDFFKKKAEGKSMLGGGHDFEVWENTLSQSPFRVLVEKDITENTAPTIDLVDQFSQQVLRPVMHAGTALAEQRFPMVLKIVRYFYRKKLEKMQAKHFSGERTGEKFKHFKKYMFYLLQLT